MSDKRRNLLRTAEIAVGAALILAGLIWLASAPALGAFPLPPIWREQSMYAAVLILIGAALIVRKALERLVTRHMHERLYPELVLFPTRESRREAGRRVTALTLRSPQFWLRAIVVMCGAPLVCECANQMPNIASALAVEFTGFAIMVIAIARFVMPIRRMRRMLREALRESGIALCLECGYDLSGNASGICPECGMRIAERPDERVAAGSVAGFARRDER